MLQKKLSQLGSQNAAITRRTDVAKQTVRNIRAEHHNVHFCVVAGRIRGRVDAVIGVVRALVGIGGVRGSIVDRVVPRLIGKELADMDEGASVRSQSTAMRAISFVYFISVKYTPVGVKPVVEMNHGVDMHGTST